MNGRTKGHAIWALSTFGAAIGFACSEEFTSDSNPSGAAGAAATSGSAGTGGTAATEAGGAAGQPDRVSGGSSSGGRPSGGSASGGSSTSGNGGSADGEPDAAGAAGASVAEGACTTEEDCSPQAMPQACSGAVACLAGACVTLPAKEGSRCEGGACDAGGHCVSTCDSKRQDGDETGIDCGGSCKLCPDGQGCGAPGDCLSGVCGNGKCQASACSDKVKNGSETSIDCGGSCPLRCALGQGCGATTDCAVAAGDVAESVRCVAKVCVSTKPPSAGGAPLFWQDFRADRLQANAESCAAADKTCLMGNGSFYPLSGIGPGGVSKLLTKALVLTTEGVVGGGGKFDGYTCLTRAGTNLSLANVGTFTAMAWVKPTRVAAPWESAIIGGPNHYFIAVDTNPASQRFLAAVATAQSTSFDYRSSAGTGELPNGKWHHVAATYSTSAAKLIQYVDGKLVHSTALAGNITTGAVEAYIGCRKAAAVSNFFQGTLDEITLYRRALSAEELVDYVTRTALP